MGIPPIALICDVERPFDFCDNSYLQHLKNYEVVFMFSTDGFLNGGKDVMSQTPRIWKAVVTLAHNLRAVAGMERILKLMIETGVSTKGIEDIQKSIGEQKLKSESASKDLHDMGLDVGDSDEMKRFRTAFDNHINLGIFLNTKQAKN